MALQRRYRPAAQKRRPQSVAPQHGHPPWRSTPREACGDASDGTASSWSSVRSATITPLRDSRAASTLLRCSASDGRVAAVGVAGSVLPNPWMDHREYASAEYECEHSFIDDVPLPLPAPEECEESYERPVRRPRRSARAPLAKLSTVVIMVIALFIIGFIVFSPLLHRML